MKYIMTSLIIMILSFSSTYADDRDDMQKMMQQFNMETKDADRMMMQMQKEGDNNKKQHYMNQHMNHMMKMMNMMGDMDHMMSSNMKDMPMSGGMKGKGMMNENGKKSKDRKDSNMQGGMMMSQGMMQMMDQRMDMMQDMMKQMLKHMEEMHKQ